MLAALGGTEHSLGNARQPRAPTLTQQPPDLAFLHGCAQVLLEPDVPLDEAPLVQEDEDIRGGQRHLVDGEAVHVLEGLCYGGPVPQHRVERPKEVHQLGGGQGGPVGSQCHRLSKGCPGPGRSVGQRRKSKDTNRPPVTQVSSYDRQTGTAGAGNGGSEHPRGGRRTWSPTPPGGTGTSLEIAADRELGREPGGQGATPQNPRGCRLLSISSTLRLKSKGLGKALGQHCPRPVPTWPLGGNPAL